MKNATSDYTSKVKEELPPNHPSPLIDAVYRFSIVGIKDGVYRIVFFGKVQDWPIYGVKRRRSIGHLPERKVPHSRLVFLVAGPILNLASFLTGRAWARAFFMVGRSGCSGTLWGLSYVTLPYCVSWQKEVSFIEAMGKFF